MGDFNSNVLDNTHNEVLKIKISLWPRIRFLAHTVTHTVRLTLTLARLATTSTIPDLHTTDNFTTTSPHGKIA